MVTIFILLYIVVVARQVSSLQRSTNYIAELNANFTNQLDHIILVASFDHPTHAVYLLEFRIIPQLEQRLNVSLRETIAEPPTTEPCVQSVAQQMRVILSDIVRSVNDSLPDAVRSVCLLVRWFYTRLIMHLQQGGGL